MDVHHYEKDGFDKLLNTVRITGFSEPDINRITEAYHFAEKAHDGQKRRSGEPYIIHPVAVAQILAEMGMDADSAPRCFMTLLRIHPLPTRR